MAMTARQVWEGMLTELSKVNAPSMLLQDFNYFFNKAINQYINKRYNVYDISQQTTDDLRVLKATTILTPEQISNTISGVNTSDWKAGNASLFGATYEVYLPLDYLHMLNCVCIYKLNKRFKCYNAGDYVQFAAKRLTADSWSVILNDYYNRPLPWRPYYYIHNVNTSIDLPTNPLGGDIEADSSVKELSRTTVGTDPIKNYEVNPGSNSTLSDGPNSNLPRTISIEGITNNSVVEREAGVRYGNSSSVRCEIRYGSDNSVFKLQSVVIDYIKAPQTIRLTQEQVDLTEDTSQIMEFPDYVCQEIINELTMLVMENTADPRLQTNTVVTQSIANPAQQQAQQPQPQQRG